MFWWAQEAPWLLWTEALQVPKVLLSSLQDGGCCWEAMSWFSAQSTAPWHRLGFQGGGSMGRKTSGCRGGAPFLPRHCTVLPKRCRQVQARGCIS